MKRTRHRCHVVPVSKRLRSPLKAKTTALGSDPCTCHSLGTRLPIAGQLIPDPGVDVAVYPAGSTSLASPWRVASSTNLLDS